MSSEAQVSGLQFNWYKSKTTVSGLTVCIKMLVFKNMPYQLSAEAQDSGHLPCWSTSKTLVPGLISCFCLYSLVLRNLPYKAVVKYLRQHKSKDSHSHGPSLNLWFKV